MTTFTTKQDCHTLQPTFWYERSTEVSGSGEMTFAVVDSRGSTVEAELVSVGHDDTWTEVLRASARTSFAFLADEPDLYED